MIKAVVFGAGGTGKRVYNMVKNEVEVVCFVDNDPQKVGGYCEGREIRTPSFLKELGLYDKIYMGTLMGLKEVQKQLKEFHVPLERLDKTYVEISVKSRILFLKRFSERVYKQGIEGAVGECGVYRGEFAKEINRLFPDRTCYLFDTFEGFDERDYKYEQAPSETRDVYHLSMTSVNIVMDKMPYKEKIVVRKGYFPETIGDLEDKFVFVNLDMDLYQPTLEGLRYFYPRMSAGGIILVHDYFSEIFPNVENAINDFELESGNMIRKMPIGDDISMAIIK